MSQTIDRWEISERSRTGPGPLPRLVRGFAWVALVGVAVVVVRAEAGRPTLPAGVEAYTDIVYRRVGLRQVKLDVYVPSSPAPVGGRPTVLAIHGGGWRGGSKSGYGRETARLAGYGFVVVSAGYRLSKPDEPSWPDNLDDVREAVRWVRRHADEYGIDSNRIVAMGASAGGHLAALLGTYPDGPITPEAQVESRRKSGSETDVSARVQAVIDFYGPTDLRAMYSSSPAAAETIGLLLGCTPVERPACYEAASPALHVSPDDPPMLLVHGGGDRMIPTSQAEQLAAELARAGVAHRLIVIPDARHGFGLHVDRRDLVPEILAFLNEVWKDKMKYP
jgi:acetyl esterase/lipase